MHVVAMLQSNDVVGQQPATHVPLIVVNRQESVTAQAYGYSRHRHQRITRGLYVFDS